MTLKEASYDIDKLLRRDCQVWRERMREMEEVIDEQDAILRSDEAQNDHSENAVFINAQDAKQSANQQLQSLSEKVQSFEKIFASISTDNYVPEGVVRIGSTVRLRHEGASEDVIIKIVPKKITSPLVGAVSPSSSLGSSLLNKHEGETTESKTTRGIRLSHIKEVY